MPESDPGDGEINDVEEFLREFDRVEYDETLINLVGEGYDVNAPGDQAVADLLGAWRDDVGRVPVDEGRFPSAHTASGRMPPTTGGTPSMAISEDAANLASIAQDGTAQGAIQAAYEAVQNTAAALQQAISTIADHGARAAGAAGGAEGDALNGAAQGAIQNVENTLSQVAMFDSDELIGQINVFYNAVSDAAAKHSGG